MGYVISGESFRSAFHHSSYVQGTSSSFGFCKVMGDPYPPLPGRLVAERSITTQLLQLSIQLTVQSLTQPRVTITSDKSELRPTQDLVFIGRRLRTNVGMVSLPEDRVHTLIILIIRFNGSISPSNCDFVFWRQGYSNIWSNMPDFV